MSEETLEYSISGVKEKKNRPIHYEYKVLNKKPRTIMGIRKSKKGGSKYSNAFLDLIYLMGKFDPAWMDKLVKDPDFPIFLEQMRLAYERTHFTGWSPKTIKEIEEYAKKNQEVEKKND